MYDKIYCARPSFGMTITQVFWDLVAWHDSFMWFFLQTFDECVAKDGVDCDVENLWMQIPFFCGHASECW